MLGGDGGRENETLGRLTYKNMIMPLPLQLDQRIVGVGDEELPRRDERMPQWSQQETRDFIQICAELERDFTIAKRNKALWEVVASKMKERGYRRNPDQCKCKWNNLINGYKGKETPDYGRQFPFFEELHALFTERAKNMQRLLLESETGSVQSKKRVKRLSGDQSSEEFSECEDEDEYESDEERVTKGSNPRRRKADKEKRLQKSALEKPSRPLNTGNVNNSGSGLGSSIQEILRDFFQQQQMIEMQWRELMERRAYERQLFEQEWCQSMETLERERMMIEQEWREKEEQRRMREESRAERRDALLTALMNKLSQANHH